MIWDCSSAVEHPAHNRVCEGSIPFSPTRPVCGAQKSTEVETAKRASRVVGLVSHKAGGLLPKPTLPSNDRAHSSARIERLASNQMAEGSNPSAPVMHDTVRYRCSNCGYSELGRPEWNWSCPKCGR